MRASKLGLLGLLAVFLGDAAAWADYKGECLGPTGKFRNCRMGFGVDEVVLTFHPNGKVQIPVAQITNLTEKPAPASDQSGHPVVAVPTEGATVYVPLNQQANKAETDFTLEFVDLEGFRRAFLMRVPDKTAPGLKAQLEAVTQRRFGAQGQAESRPTHHQ